MALTATIGGSTSNSYVTLTEANDYFADRLNTAQWDAATSETKEKALITATRRIDEEQFFGYKVSTTQALKWPRYNVRDEDGFFFLPSDSIPERVKQAVFVTARELLRADFLDENYLDNLQSISAGNTKLVQFSPRSAGRLPADAMRLLQRFMTSGNGARLVRA
jgi:hypothetical protein